MDEQRLDRRKFIVKGASGVHVISEYLNKHSCLSEISENAKTGKKGLLQLFRIDPISGKPPAFLVRIGHDDHEAVDVDLLGNKLERLAFRTQAPGYEGHKSQALGTNPRSYRLTIKVPSVGRVFSGTVTMTGVDLGLRLEARMSMNATLTTNVLRRKPSESEH
jgi:hypothetical protein